MVSPKICILTETYYPVIGGGETQARLLAEGLVSDGLPVQIVTRRSDADQKRYEEYGSIGVHRLAPVGSGQLKKWGLLFSSLPALLKLRHQYDLVFVSGFRIVGVSAVIASKLLGKRCILKADSQGEMSGDFFEAGLARIGLRPSSRPFKAFLNLRNAVLKRADVFTAITSDIVAELDESGVDKDAVRMIPNSVDTSQFHGVNGQRKRELREKLGIPELNTAVVYTGRLVSYKGLPLLLNVWKAIQDRHPNATLLLVGTGGLDIHNCEDELKAFTAVNDMESSVRFTGSVRNVPEYLQASDIFVFPTENDAFPSSLIEAMSCELPVIATPVGAIKNIVADGENGLMIQPGSYEQLFDALEKLITDKKLAERLGEAGWQTVQERYASTSVNKQYIELFRSVINTADVISAEVTAKS
jgi:glycosyltransferase involved in cell wall biosynthesis